MMKKICFLPDGCSAREPDIRRIMSSVEGSYEFTRDPTEADVILQNVCAFTISEPRINRVTANLLYLRKVKKDGAIAIVYGCGAEAFKEEIFKAAGVDYVIKDKIVEQVTKILGVKPSNKFYLKNSIELVINLVPGCAKIEGYCYFCKQNYMKKKPYSAYRIEEVVEMVIEYGMPVLYLTGMNNCNYGLDYGDHKPKLHLLLRELEKIPSLKYIDIDGIAPSCVYPELLEELQRNSKVFSIQFMIQSGSNSMLAQMNIGTTVEKLEVALQHLKGKKVVTGVVVSHPGETLEDVKQTIDFLRKWNIWNCRVQPYTNSRRTPSYKMEQLPEDVYKQHYGMVKEAVENLAKTFLNEQVGKRIRGFVAEINPRYNEPIVCCATEFEATFCIKEFSRPLRPGDYVEAVVTEVIRDSAQNALLIAEEIVDE